MSKTIDRNITLLTDCGTALYGPLWQSELSRELEVADRTVRRWVSGDTPIPVGVWIDLMRLMSERTLTLDELVERCKRAH